MAGQHAIAAAGTNHDGRASRIGFDWVRRERRTVLVFVPERARHFAGPKRDWTLRFSLNHDADEKNCCQGRSHRPSISTLLLWSTFRPLPLQVSQFLTRLRQESGSPSKKHNVLRTLCGIA